MVVNKTSYYSDDVHMLFLFVYEPHWVDIFYVLCAIYSGVSLSILDGTYVLPGIELCDWTAYKVLPPVFSSAFDSAFLCAKIGN